MNDPDTSYREYLAALRELDTVRAAEDTAAAQRRSGRAGIDADMDRLWQRLAVQRGTLATLAADCRLPAPPTHPQPGTVVTGMPTDPVAEIRAAAGDVEDAEAGYVDARYLAHRPKLLPHWRGDERNGLVYGGFALLSLLAQVLVLATAAGTERLSEVIGQLLGCLVLPFMAFAAGWLTIGAVSRPVLEVPGSDPDRKLPRNPRLGLAICLSTWLVSCWLGNLYLNF
jgi:hypothetical protein